MVELYAGLMQRAVLLVEVSLAHCDDLCSFAAGKITTKHDHMTVV